MNVLLVDVDGARRERLADFLRGRGHRVSTALGVDDGLRALRAQDFEALVAAWELGPDDASALVASSPGPCIVLARSPAAVLGHPAIAAILVEPAAPARIAALLAELEGRSVDGAGLTQGCLPGLPADTRDRVLAVLAILDDPGSARVDDDGRTVTVEGRLTSPERWVALLDGIGGDLRVLSEAGGDDEVTPLRLVLRLDRRGLPADVEVAIAAGDPWPAAERFAIDFHGVEVSPDRFLALCDQVRRAVRNGREVEMINVPPHLRLCLEAVGRGDDLPIRRATGPRLPEALGTIWR
jgi:hypothetical protein